MTYVLKRLTGWRMFDSTIVIGLAIALSSVVVAQQPDCIAAAPCHCNGGDIVCSNLNLTTVPKFSVSKTNYTTLNILLSYNNINTIPDSAFFNLSTTNCSDIRIYFDNNLLTELGSGAFNGINDSVTDLQLHANKLISVPKSLMTLTNIQSLSLYQNMIHEFDQSVMQSVGLTLISLRIGADTPYKWPPEFRYLFNLQALSVFYFEQDFIPVDAFLGFEKTLTSLQLEYTRLSTIPTALCSVPNLKSFSFNFNTYTSSISRILPTCIPILSSVKTAIIVGNNLDVFPPVFDTFPGITTLKLTNNPNLVYIDETTVEDSSSLTGLDISFNGFEQFPESLQKLTQLEHINIASNKIATIENFNIPNMTNLRSLDLSHNPISYISENAFIHLSNLESLNLDSIPETEFPRAVKTLSKLRILSLRNNRILCSCGMSWILTEWKMYDKVTIDGYCGSSSLSVIDYITKYLPSCPKLQF